MSGGSAQSNVELLLKNGFSEEALNPKLLEQRRRAEALREQTLAKLGAFAPSRVYREGRRFRVAVDFARLEALIYFGQPREDGFQAWAGWSRPLRQGEIVTCLGWSEAYQHAHVLTAVFDAEGVPDGARYTAIWPLNGLWQPYPMSGVLEPLEDEEDDGE